eukprot:1393721-Amorphochlora_amoeboformis.AAC.1
MYSIAFDTSPTVAENQEPAQEPTLDNKDVDIVVDSAETGNQNATVSALPETQVEEAQAPAQATVQAPAEPPARVTTQSLAQAQVQLGYSYQDPVDVALTAFVLFLLLSVYQTNYGNSLPWRLDFVSPILSSHFVFKPRSELKPKSSDFKSKSTPKASEFKTNFKSSPSVASLSKPPQKKPTHKSNSKPNTISRSQLSDSSVVRSKPKSNFKDVFKLKPFKPSTSNRTKRNTVQPAKRIVDHSPMKKSRKSPPEAVAPRFSTDHRNLPATNPPGCPLG